MKKNALDLIDFDKVDSLLEGFNKSTGFVTAILDVDGNVLSKSGWRQICTEFHRINPATSERCTTSDTVLSNKMTEDEKYHFYKCLNGLIDVAVPVIIDGEHVANLFSGQFFFEEPDISFFKKQAKKFGFDESNYLDALSKVPIVSEEKVKTAMDFLLSMTLLISDLAFQKAKQLELNKQISESKNKFESVFNSANTGKSITLPTGEINVNLAFCEMLGYSPEELESKKWQDITPQDEISAVQKILNPMLNGEKDSARFEKRYICKDGSYKWADVSVSLLRDEDDKPIHFITTVIDITERKQAEQQIIEAKEKAEESEEKYRAMYNNAPLSYQSLDENGCFIDINPMWSKMLGYERDEVIGKWYGDFLHPDYVEHFRKNFPAFKKRGYVSDVQFKLRRKDNSYIYVSFEGCVGYTPGGNFRQTYCVFKDITEQKALENAILKAKQKVEESEAKLNALFTSMSEMVVLHELVFDGDGKPVNYRITDCNHAFTKITGIKRKNAIGRLSTEVYGTEHPPYFSEYSAVALTGEPQHYETYFPPMGKHFSISVISPEKNHFATVTTDITEIKQAEQELIIAKERAERNEIELMKAQEIAHLGSWYLDVKTDQVVWTEELYKIFGFDHTIPPPPYTEHKKLFTPESWQILSTSLAKTRETGIPYELELKTIRKDNSNGWMWVRGEAVLDTDKKIIGLWGAAQDITERKRAELELAESAERYKSLHNASFGGIAIHDKGIILECNQGLSEMTGYSFDELIGMDGLLLIAPEHREMVMNKIINGYEKPYEANGLRRNGEQFPMRLEARNIPYKGKNVRTVEFRDITERKQAEQQIIAAKEKAEESEENLSITLHSIGDGVITTDKFGMIDRMNPVALKLCGWQADEIIGKPLTEVFNIISADTREPVPNPVEKVIENGEIVGLANHTVLVAKDGREYQIADSAAPIKDKDGNIKGVVLVFSDVSEKYAAEEERRKSDERFRIAQEMSPDGFMILHPVRDAQNRVIDFTWIYENDAIARLNETDPQKVVGKRLLELFPGHRDTQFVKAYQQVAESGESIIFEEGYAGESMQKQTWLRIVVVPMGENIAVLAQNITERKLAEQALKESEEKTRYILKHNPNAIAVFDNQMNLLIVSDRFLKDYDEKGKNIIGKKLYEVFPEIPEKWRSAHKKALQGEVLSNEDDYFIRPDGSITYSRWECRPWYHSDKSIGGMIAYTEVITERKLAEMALLAKMDELERFHKLTVDREITMVELKKEVNNLLKRIGEDPKYKIVE